MGVLTHAWPAGSGITGTAGWPRGRKDQCSWVGLSAPVADRGQAVVATKTVAINGKVQARDTSLVMNKRSWIQPVPVIVILSTRIWGVNGRLFLTVRAARPTIEHLHPL